MKCFKGHAYCLDIFNREQRCQGDFKVLDFLLYGTVCSSLYTNVVHIWTNSTAMIHPPRSVNVANIDRNVDRKENPATYFFHPVTLLSKIIYTTFSSLNKKLRSSSIICVSVSGWFRNSFGGVIDRFSPGVWRWRSRGKNVNQKKISAARESYLIATPSSTIYCFVASIPPLLHPVDQNHNLEHIRQVYNFCLRLFRDIPTAQGLHSARWSERPVLSILPMKWTESPAIRHRGTGSLPWCVDNFCRPIEPT